MVMDLKRCKVGVLRGGPSSERDISLLSGASVVKALESMNFEVEDIVVPAKRDLEYLEDWTLSVLKEKNIDVCFIALHGWFGEDGNIQKILSESSYPYTGSDESSCKMAMDKVSSKNIFKKEFISTPRYLVVDVNREADLSSISFPAVLKPSSQGSSIGVHKVENIKEASALMSRVIDYDGKALIEDFIEGLELTVGIVEDKPLAVIEISYSDDIYSYGVKYTDGLSKYSIPAKIDKDLTERIKSLALKAHKAIRCNTFSRVDMLYSIVDDKAYVLEVNTIPGLTEVSLLPKAAKFCGIEFDDLVLKMLKSAFKENKCLKK